MLRLEHQIGSAHNLVVFEAAARHLSFSRAAEELSVSQPAVSQALRRLEDAIGTRLFLRRHRGIALTDAGERLYRDVSDSFQRILATARQIGRGSAGDHVTLLVSTAFATWWMVPHLQEFHALNPGFDLRLETVNRDIEIASPATTLAVRRGDGNWTGYYSARIAPERLLAVASPALLRRLPPINTLADLASQQLVHLDEPHRYRPTWASFFRHFGASYPERGDGLRLNDYALVLQAAMAGEGIALGWDHVCRLPIGQRLIIPVGPWRWETGAGFYLVWSNTDALSDRAALTRDWILSKAEVLT
ncbi:LysR substrate-binding domain-containing protein [Paracoccus sp. TOH]|uniref:LysR substrate-binding domain-containing protein n=1 Tax=Paracoccus sp. TOH TaxID=1263728 RepID=UPI0025B02A33|nr:LysR substrate-binding domain-containing protein [Paracoccus sp. TOH]WJS87324.1 LysR substrate-binding domain-containing protein [Paracoccus sp. TOH]